MLRSVSLLLLMALYIIPSSGVMVMAHFCGGKLNSVALNRDKPKPCKCSKKKGKSKCCSSSKQYVKIKQSQLPAAQTEMAVGSVLLKASCVPATSFCLITLSPEASSKAPPGKNIPFFISCHSLLI
jgi:hypothetical protein